MPTERMGDYLVEYAGEPLSVGPGWAAFLTIYTTTPNPAHRTSLFPRQRVRLDTVFLTRDAAEEAAREVAEDKITGSRRGSAT